MKDVIDDYNGFIDGCMDLNAHSRSLLLQKVKVEEIEPRIAQMKGYKAQAVGRNDERVAKLMFHFQCMLRSMESSLKVWVAVKAGCPQEAWNHLVDAQEYKDVAILAEDHEGVRRLERQLSAMEHALFPQFQLFNSAGFTETIGNCSICGRSFAECDHVENVIYMGRLCRRVNRQVIEANHVALVKHPRDRRCVITKRSDDSGRMIDHFTLEDVGPNDWPDDGAMRVEAAILSFRTLDFD